MSYIYRPKAPSYSTNHPILSTSNMCSYFVFPVMISPLHGSGDLKKWTIYDNGFVDHVPISNGYSHVTFYIYIDEYPLTQL